MKLSNLIEEDLMSFDLRSKEKDDVIGELVDLAAQSKLVRDKDL